MPPQKPYHWFIFLLVMVFLVTTLPFTAAQDTASTCPLGQGYWKTQSTAWPVSEMVIGGQTYTQAELIDLLNLSPQGDASLILAHQLIAARLNAASGADTAAIDAIITQADTLLAGFDGKLPYAVAPASETGQQMVIAGSTFDAFNQGLLTVDCVDMPEITPEPEVTPEMTPEPEVTPEPADDDLTITIVIEGPVEKINVNIITIYGIDIAIASDNPILITIQIGDNVRIEGHIDDDADTLVIIAVNVTIITVEVYVNDTNPQETWTDSGSCKNPPPDWAPANGWRRRCEGRDDDDDDD